MRAYKAIVFQALAHPTRIAVAKLLLARQIVLNRTVVVTLRVAIRGRPMDTEASR